MIAVIVLASMLPLVGVLAVVWYLRKVSTLAVDIGRIADQLEAREPTKEVGQAEPRPSEPR